MRSPFVALSFAACALGAATTIPLNFSSPGASFEGIGALSGGGGVTRLLIDYPQPLQQDIFDILFKPDAGSALQIIKVEIGGDTQSTEGGSHRQARCLFIRPQITMPPHPPTLPHLPRPRHRIVTLARPWRPQLFSRIRMESSH